MPFEPPPAPYASAAPSFQCFSLVLPSELFGNVPVCPDDFHLVLAENRPMRYILTLGIGQVRLAEDLSQGLVNPFPDLALLGFGCRRQVVVKLLVHLSL